jgi:hypothetical protein
MRYRLSVAIALSSCLVITGLSPRPARANPAVLPAAAACVASVGCVLAVVVITGITYYAITYEGEETQYVPMIDDPDAEVEYWEGETFANSLEEANTKCRQQAENMTRSGGSLVESQGAEQISGKLYKCKYKSEVNNG